MFFFDFAALLSRKSRLPLFRCPLLGLNGPHEKSAARLRPSGPTIAHSGRAGRQDARPGAESAGRYGLYRPLHRAGIHLDLPGDRAARFRPSGHRLCAGPMARRIEIAEALPPELPQPRRLPRGLHRSDRQGPGRAAQAALVQNRGLLVPARRHADRRVLAERQAAKGVWIPDQGVAPYRGRG